MRSQKNYQRYLRREEFSQVLNAKYHEQEAEIISHAGELGMVTIATNMAGRGTDIKLGEGVVEVVVLRSLVLQDMSLEELITN